jgi:hypothetical protein
VTEAIKSALDDAAELFHEIGSAIAAQTLITDVRNAKLAESLRENLRSTDQLRVLASRGYSLCMGAAEGVAQVKDHTLHRLVDLFHQIRLVMFDDLWGPHLDMRVRSLSADGFELCVYALHALGATDVTIHQCGAEDMERW